LKLPHRAFHRGIGQFSEIQTDPEGEIITQSEWDRRHSEWLPSQQDQAYVQSLMQPVTEPGKMPAGLLLPEEKSIAILLNMSLCVSIDFMARKYYHGSTHIKLSFSFI